MWLTGILGEMKQDQIIIHDDPPSEPPVLAADPPASTLQEAWSQEDLSLQAEPAMVSSDSEEDEDPPASVSCSRAEHSEGNAAEGPKEEDEEEGQALEDEEEEGQALEDEEEEGQALEDEEEEGQALEDGEEEGQALEDGEEEGQALEEEEIDELKDGVMEGGEEQMESCTSAEPDRRLPLDFCVQQENLSENVSTEHLDFLVARQQWKKMEEEVKGLPIPKPGLGAKGSFQGTHSSLYPPTRSPRLRHRELHPPMPKEPPLSSTLSPGSEDSGLDDSSFRSHVEEQESAVEREIRLTLEREEQHRRERGMIVQGLAVPRYDKWTLTFPHAFRTS
ncbi:PREDICTED: neurofilament medium polypeptide-like [Cyprinodon variegatus]|uniref:neurofilament medium polypeptide-like n=1 Tax=Cyprinodon variegatus TaxID=28743 RepID=UPI000742A906|nr:PREDICTED: neurofilament medium polypeptide-like [Cyprinodon variegatus]